VFARVAPAAAVGLQRCGTHYAMPKQLEGAQTRKARSSLTAALAAAGFAMLSAAEFDAAECAGKRKRKADDDEEDMYEVDFIVARARVGAVTAP